MLTNSGSRPGRSARVTEDLRARRQIAAVGRGERSGVEHVVRELVVRIQRLEIEPRRPARIIEMLAGGRTWTLK
jgi:hypothetical protein